MKKKLCVLLIVITSIILTACGGYKKSENVSKDSVAQSTSGTVGFANTESGNYQEAKPEEALTDNADTKTALDSENGDVVSERKLIKNAELEVETLEFERFIDLLEAKVTETGGYIESSNTSNNSYHYNRLKYANYTLRIPSDKLDEFVHIVGENANIVNTSTSTDDVTLSYYDSESRKKALEIQQERLLALLEKADKVEDIIELESRLSEVTYQLESQSTILRNYDNLVEYSTVRLNINEVERETQKAPETIGDKMKTGLSETFYNIKEGLENLVVFVVVNFPYIIFWGVVIVGAILVIKKKWMKNNRSHSDQIKNKEKDNSSDK